MDTNVTVLASGLTVVTARLPGFLTTQVGVYVNVGSRFETPEINGITHFLEHMLFKGTARRTAKQIAFEVENAGAIINAYTTKTMTAYYVVGLEEHTELSLDILSDMLLNSEFSQDELEREREVVIQEIAKSRDDPDDVVYDLFGKLTYPDQALGRTILGPAEVIRDLTRDDLVRYTQAHYRANNMVVCAVGAVDHDAFVRQTERRFSGLTAQDRITPEGVRYQGGYGHDSAPFDQVTVMLGFPIVGTLDPRHATYDLLSDALGGGMSSPLFQEIREKRGLVYSVGSYAMTISDSGLFTIYGGTSADKVQEFIEVATDELARVAERVTPGDFSRARNGVRTQAARRRENKEAVSRDLVTSLFDRGRIVTTEEILADYERVTPHMLADAARDMLAGTPTLALVGSTVEDADYLGMVQSRLSGFQARQPVRRTA